VTEYDFEITIIRFAHFDGLDISTSVGDLKFERCE